MRHWNQIEGKARGHEVGVHPSAGFVVRSGETGEVYTVALTNVGPVCSCKWGKFNGAGCSHAVAVNAAVARMGLSGSPLPVVEFEQERLDRRVVVW